MALPPVLDEENLYKFRTKICERYVKQGKCEFADKCQYSHDLRWTRRPPWKYTYSPELCKELIFVTDGRGRTIAKSSCKQKRNCKFSHTKEEQMYHPKIYKTILCRQHQDNGWCDRYYCPFAHSVAEQRPIDSLFDPKNILPKAPGQEELCPDIYLPSDRPHPRLRARFLSIMDGSAPLTHLRLNLDSSLVTNSGLARSRQPYTDFISSHTPHSVLSESSPCNMFPVAHSAKRINGIGGHQPHGNEEGSLVNSLPGPLVLGNPLQQNMTLLKHSDLSTTSKQQQTTSRLIQLLQAKQCMNDNFGDPSIHGCLVSSAQKAASMSTTQAILPFALPGTCNTNIAPQTADTFRIEHFPSVSMKNQGFTATDQAKPAMVPLPDQNKSSNSVFCHPVAQPQFSAATPSSMQPSGVISKPECNTIREVSSTHPEKCMSSSPHARTMPTSKQYCNVGQTMQGQFSVKCLSADVCYWNEPIGHSRDDPSVLVYAGLSLGSEKGAKEVVAIKQLPVVVANRVGDLWLEMEKFLMVKDPRIVNIKRVLFLPGDGDEGTSLWLVTDKCQGCLMDLVSIHDISVSSLQSTVPPPGITGMLSHILSAVLVLHQQSGSAHMRIHPRNIMLAEQCELKLGDCGGKIRYLSIFDLLHAGIQGAKNARALLHWILGTPSETCWMAPEFLQTIISLEDQLTLLTRQYIGLPEHQRNENVFVALANACTWNSEMLRKADIWSTGATLFYIVSGGYHAYGDQDAPEIQSNILDDKKINMEKLSGSPWLLDLLSGLLASDPNQRLELPQALCHPLFWKAEDFEHYVEAFGAAVEDPELPEAQVLLGELSYGIKWVDALPTMSSTPLLPLLISYMAGPAAPTLLLSSYPSQSASSFLVFLGLVAKDQRLVVFDRRKIILECLLSQSAAFLASVRLFLFPRIPPPSEFLIRKRDCLAAILSASLNCNSGIYPCGDLDYGSGHPPLRSDSGANFSATQMCNPSRPLSATRRQYCPENTVNTRLVDVDSSTVPPPPFHLGSVPMPITAPVFDTGVWSSASPSNQGPQPPPPPPPVIPSSSLSYSEGSRNHLSTASTFNTFDSSSDPIRNECNKVIPLVRNLMNSMSAGGGSGRTNTKSYSAESGARVAAERLGDVGKLTLPKSHGTAVGIPSNPDACAPHRLRNRSRPSCADGSKKPAITSSKSMAQCQKLEKDPTRREDATEKPKQPPSELTTPAPHELNTPVYPVAYQGKNGSDSTDGNIRDASVAEAILQGGKEPEFQKDNQENESNPSKMSDRVTHCAAESASRNSLHSSSLNKREDSHMRTLKTTTDQHAAAREHGIPSTDHLKNLRKVSALTVMTHTETRPLSGIVPGGKIVQLPITASTVSTAHSTATMSDAGQAYFLHGEGSAECSDEALWPTEPHVMPPILNDDLEEMKRIRNRLEKTIGTSDGIIKRKDISVNNQSRKPGKSDKCQDIEDNDCKEKENTNTCPMQ